MHEHHRERMRTRYHISGFDSFSEHEILEMILYHSIPRGDTNELAHTLLERFGGFHGVIEATPDELKSVKGIGESSAMLIKLIEASVRSYAASLSQETVQYDTVSKIALFAWRRYLGMDRERVYLLLFDNKMSMVDCIAISDGTVNASSLPPRLIVEKAFTKKASSVVLTHNHPHGLVRPSPEDFALTRRLNEGLAIVGIPLLEHLVITNDRFFPIIKNDTVPREAHAGNAALVGTSIVDFEHFYDVDENDFRFTPVLKQVAGCRSSKIEE